MTVVGGPRDSLRTGRPQEPAVFRSTEALLMRPGFLSAALREPRARRRILTTTTTTATPVVGPASPTSGRTIAARPAPANASASPTEKLASWP